ncbi:helix-turn-helix domain-containing protein [Vagococcus hydrophili]|uniref:Helix-turn-helix transcriptional regulator n=1 Tax=Vagococcus hydrophili TaxID=2714947 RepID=A0A6G8ARJ6_9ENTE|nr:helix-turn-helix transcriptional regulator [Vagococcus hydrophili]QIL47562.1 helix-turn-helix transcriptional regulator [Vagococcus hydrophili]
MDNNKPSPIEVGQRIRNIRLEKGMSMDDFGFLIDGSAKSGTIANWETGKNLPNPNRLKRIAEIGNTTTLYLLYGILPLDNQYILPKEDSDEIKLVLNQDKTLNIKESILKSVVEDLTTFNYSNLNEFDLSLLFHSLEFIKLDSDEQIEKLLIKFISNLNWKIKNQSIDKDIITKKLENIITDFENDIEL